METDTDTRPPGPKSVEEMLALPVIDRSRYARPSFLGGLHGPGREGDDVLWANDKDGEVWEAVWCNGRWCRQPARLL